MPAVSSIQSLPAFVTPEEHENIVGSTPASFSDIPPVLRHKEENAAIVFDPPFDEFSPQDCVKGTLYIIESALIFLSSTGRGVRIEYPSITLHAISRTESGPSIYCQLDESIPGDEDSCLMRELIISPQNVSLEPIFEALSFCAALHPDQGESDHDFDDDFIAADASTFEVFNGNDDQELSEAGRAALEHLESVITYNIPSMAGAGDVPLNNTSSATSSSH